MSFRSEKQQIRNPNPERCACLTEAIIGLSIHCVCEPADLSISRLLMRAAMRFLPFQRFQLDCGADSFAAAYFSRLPLIVGRNQATNQPSDRATDRPPARPTFAHLRTPGHRMPIRRSSTAIPVCWYRHPVEPKRSRPQRRSRSFTWIEGRRK